MMRRLATAGLVPHVVHRLSNSMVVLIGAIEMLELTEQDPERRARLESASSEAHTCSDLIRALSCYAASDSAGEGALDLSSVMRLALELGQSVLHTARYTLDEHLAGAGELLVRGDEERFEHLAMLLLFELLGGPEPDRARCQSFGPGRLRVRAQVRAGRAELTLVCVRGAQAEPFGVAGPSFDAALAIVTEFGGQLGVRSLGARRRALRVHLPLLGVRAAEEEEERGSAAAPTSAADEAHVEATRLLVGELDEVLAGLLLEVLGEAGFVVEVAGSADELLQMAERESWALVLCDHALVQGSSESESRLQRAAPKLVWSMSGEPHEAHGLEGAHVLWKPYRPTELLALLERLGVAAS